MYGDINSRVEGLLIILLIFISLNPFSQIVSYFFIFFYIFSASLQYIFVHFKNEELRMENVEDIYRKVCDSGWIGSLCKDLRSSVFDILYDLFNKDNINSEHCRKFELSIAIINFT